MADDELDVLLAEQRAYYGARADEWDATYPVDSSSEALAICRRRVDTPHVSLVQADLFAWAPQQRYDLVFFAAWLSHVPPQRFDAFWALVADCLAPGRTGIRHRRAARGVGGRAHGTGQPAPAVERRLSTGETYRTVKVSTERMNCARGSQLWGGRPTFMRSAGATSGPSPADGINQARVSARRRLLGRLPANDCRRSSGVLVPTTEPARGGLSNESVNLGERVP